MFLIAAKLKSYRYIQAKEYSSLTINKYKKNHILSRSLPSYFHSAKSMGRISKNS